MWIWLLLLPVLNTITRTGLKNDWACCCLLVPERCPICPSFFWWPSMYGWLFWQKPTLWLHLLNQAFQEESSWDVKSWRAQRVVERSDPGGQQQIIFSRSLSAYLYHFSWGKKVVWGVYSIAWQRRCYYESLLWSSRVVSTIHPITALHSM